jgi:nitrite reductase/ring-hydroxylating ferredoxin subunit
MDMIRAGRVAEVRERGRKVLALLGRKVGVFADGDGFFALELTCKHQGADLSAGRVERGVVTCPRHGWRYELATGRCLDHASAPLRRHDLEVRGEDIWISLRPVEEGQPGV